MARLFKTAGRVEPYEVRAVVLSFVFFFFLLGSYFILRPMRDAMGTIFGVEHLQELYTGTFIGTFALAPIYAAAAGRIKLSTLLPWVYGMIAISLLVFYALFAADPEDRWTAAAFFIWVSVFNQLITSVFWSFMADLFSRKQSNRLYGLITAGGSLGAVAGPSLTALLVTVVGTHTLLLISAAGFVVTAVLVLLLVGEKEKLRVMGEDAQRTTLDHSLAWNPFAGFSLLAKSSYLLGIAAFIALSNWVAVILYFQQQDFISKAFVSVDERTQAFALVDVIVNVLSIGIQFFGTGWMVARFGVKKTLVFNPLLMIGALVVLAMVPGLWMVLFAQILRRTSDNALARPSREMLFTLVDQETKYKAKNVIDTVVYRFADLTGAWLQAGLAQFGVAGAGVALAGVGVSSLWAWNAARIGRRYESHIGGDKISG